jgi:chromosome segregation ATPase
MRDTTTVTNDLDRLAERIEKAATQLQAQRAEHARLLRERDQLAARSRELEQRLQGQDPAALLGELQGLRREQREWQAERREVALRIEALVKKLERIEG